jgi:hypothetical protein
MSINKAKNYSKHKPVYGLDNGIAKHSVIFLNENAWPEIAGERMDNLSLLQIGRSSSCALQKYSNGDRFVE